VAGSRVSIIDHFSLKKGCTVNQNVKILFKKFSTFSPISKYFFTLINFVLSSLWVVFSTIVLKFAWEKSRLFEQNSWLLVHCATPTFNTKKMQWHYLDEKSSKKSMHPDFRIVFEYKKRSILVKRQRRYPQGEPWLCVFVWLFSYHHMDCQMCNNWNPASIIMCNTKNSRKSWCLVFLTYKKHLFWFCFEQGHKCYQTKYINLSLKL